MCDTDRLTTYLEVKRGRGLWENDDYDSSL